MKVQIKKYTLKTIPPKIFFPKFSHFLPQKLREFPFLPISEFLVKIEIENFPLIFPNQNKINKYHRKNP